MIADRQEPVRGRWRPSPSHIVWIGLLTPALTAGISTSVGPQVALFVLMAGWLRALDGRATARALMLGAGVAALLLFHTVVAETMGTCRDLMLKSVASQVLLVVVLGALSLLASVGRSAPSQHSIARLVALLVAAVVVEKIYLLATGARETIRPSGFFSEPSHFALTIAPLLIHLILDENPRWRRAGILGAVVSLWLAASATLFLLLATGLAIMWLALHGRRLRLFKALQVMVLSAAFAGVAYVSPF